MNTVEIINTQWTTINLQVNIGNVEPADNPANQQVYNAPLAQGNSVSFDFDVFLWYRRDINPNLPDGTFRAWTRCSSDEVIDNP